MKNTNDISKLSQDTSPFYAKAFEKCVIERTGKILNDALESNLNYRNATEEVTLALHQLLDIAYELKDNQPNLQKLVHKLEEAATAESIHGAELAYKAGMRDCYALQREAAIFLSGEVNNIKMAL